MGLSLLITTIIVVNNGCEKDKAKARMEAIQGFANLCMNPAVCRSYTHKELERIQGCISEKLTDEETATTEEVKEAVSGVVGVLCVP